MHIRVLLIIVAMLLSTATGFISAPPSGPEVEAFLHHLYKQRADALITGAAHPDLTPFYDAAGVGALAHEHGRIRYMQAWALARSLQVIRAESELTNLKIRTGPDWAQVSVIVRTMLEYRYEGQEATDQMGVGSWHSLRLTRRSGQWQVSQEYYLDAMGDEWTRPYVLDEPPTLTADGAPPSERRSAAVAYAERYCGSAWGCGNEGDYNQAYRTYRNLGGDCANFASQVLTLGGGIKTDGSWRTSGRPRAGGSNWVNAHAFTQHLIYSGKGRLLARGNYAQVARKLSQLEPGDIVAYQRKGSITHVSVVTGKDKAGIPIVAAHTADRYRNPWDLGWDRETTFWLVQVNY